MIADLAAPLTRIFEASLAVSLLVILVLAVRGQVARRFGARAAYALWILPLLRLAMPPIPLAPVPEITPLTAMPAAIEETAPVELAPVREARAATTVAPVTLAATSEKTVTNVRNVSARVAPVRDVKVPVIVDVDPVLEPVPALLKPLREPASEPGPKYIAKEEARPILKKSATSSLASTSPRLALPRIDFSGFAGPVWQGLVILWALITLGLAIRLAARQILFADCVWRHTIPADPQTEAEARALARELDVRQPIAVRLCPEHQGPLVCGLFRPIVVVPEDFAFRFGPTERRYALAHELLHVRRGDLFAIFLMTLVRATQWFNPLAGRAVSAFRADQEAACDASVLRSLDGHRADYAQTLLKAVRTPSDCGPVPALTLDHGLKERLKIMNVRKTLRGGAVVVTGLAVLGLVSTASYAVQEEEAPSTDDLDRVLEGRDEPTPAPRRRDRSSEDDRRADLVRERVASLSYRLGHVRESSDVREDATQLERERIDVMREAREAERERMAEAREAEKERMAEARERQREARERAEERRYEMAERQHEAKQRARELSREAAELRRELEDDERERAAEVREWSEELRLEMAELREELAEDAREIAEEVRHEFHMSTDGHSTFVTGHDSDNVGFTIVSGDTSVSLNADDGMVLLSDPMVGLQDRMAALENFSPEIPEIPEPPTPPQVDVVEVRTADGRVIKLPETTTIVLPTLQKEMEDYSRKVEVIIAEADIDGQIKAVLGEDFDKRVEANTKQIDKLAKRCKAHQKNTDRTAVMTASQDGVTHKLLCFTGGREALKSDELARFVSTRSDINGEEKKRFKEARKGGSFAFSFHWDE